MKATDPIPMQFIEADRTKLLLGKCERPIPMDSYFVLRRVADQYQLLVVEQSNDLSDPVSLAAFLSPEDIDANERIHAACIALEAGKKKRKPRKTKRASEAKPGALKATGNKRTRKQPTKEATQ